MLILISVLLVLLPAVAILYPLLRGSQSASLPEDESSPQAELTRRWNAAIAGLKNTELEAAIGNLEEEDYRWLREQYSNEAALVMKSMELEEAQEQELLLTIEQEIQQARLRAQGQDKPPGNGKCPHCFAEVGSSPGVCPECGRRLRLRVQEPIAAPDGPEEETDA
jgi:hypothetical protein|tara:strand:- start:434 stop:931 length:498 start_codon:yes stop_codon:yes gene_type:complete